MDFKTFLIAGIYLASLAYLGESSVINTNEVPSLKEVDQTRVDDWVRVFYDRCGETEVVENRCSGGNIGPHCGREIVKKCIGDRDGCIEEMNCYFAVAITETATYRPEMVIPSTSTALPIFNQFLRTVQSYEVKVLDACHLNPVAGDALKPAQKFVGVAYGPIDSTTTNTLDCIREPTLNDFRAYFFVQDFNNCTLQPDLPVYPYIYTSETAPSPVANPIPENQFELDALGWRNNQCPLINSYLKDSKADITKQSGFMNNLLVYYYGTPDYVKNNYSYADVANWAELKGSGSIPTYLHPLAAQRVVVTEAPPESGSGLVHPSVYVFLTVSITVVKSYFV